MQPPQCGADVKLSYCCYTIYKGFITSDSWIPGHTCHIIVSFDVF